MNGSSQVCWTAGLRCRSISTVSWLGPGVLFRPIFFRLSWSSSILASRIMFANIGFGAFSGRYVGWNISFIMGGRAFQFRFVGFVIKAGVGCFDL